ncbi:MAG: OFA family MFS transporter [Armatimonadota bacterium]|nr:OFA family MFS transporter [Armatimonadota bacterium]
MTDDLARHERFRRLLVLAAVFVMMVIGIYQYSWSLFASAIVRELRWDLATVGLTFTIFTYTATFIQPLSGHVADTLGPRAVSLVASLLVGLGFLLSSRVSTPGALYLCYGLGGIGVGVLYGVSAASAIKWFPDRRGAATGLVVFGFGAGTALFNWVMQRSLDTYGFRPTLQYIGVAMLLLLVPAVLVYRYPPAHWEDMLRTSGRSKAPAVDFTPPEMLRTYQWFLIYFCFAFTVSIVLLFGAQLKMLSAEYGISATHFSVLLVLFPLGNGLSRLLAGAVSDRLGRERTMVLFYSLLGVSVLSLLQFGHSAVFFVTLVFVAALLGGAPFALYPATIGDYYGTKYATVNYGITYTAKAWAGLMSGWLSGYIVTQFGSYRIALLLIAVGSLAAAALSSPRCMRRPTRKAAG